MAAAITKYEELTKLAELRSQKVFEERETARRFAADIVVGYQRFLECDRELEFVVLDEELRTTRTKEPVSNPAPVRRGNDGSWVFAFSVRFEGKSAWMDEFITVTLRISDVRLAIESEQAFEYVLDQELNFSDFYQFLYEEAKRQFESGKINRAIGFHAKHE